MDKLTAEQRNALLSLLRFNIEIQLNDFRKELLKNGSAKLLDRFDASKATIIADLTPRVIGKSERAIGNVIGGLLILSFFVIPWCVGIAKIFG